jgi:putative FmdB family regulatory protein
MPLFNYQCRKCEAVFETLVGSGDRSAVRCKTCGGASRRLAVSSFRIIGGKSGPGSAPGRTGADFLSSHDSFVSAMNSFGDKIGDRLTNRQMEKAVEQLKQAKR